MELLNQPQAGGNETIIRRRTRRHRRNRLLRRASLLLSVVVLGIGFSTIVLRHLSPSLFHVSRSTERGSQTFDPKHDLLLLTQQETLREEHRQVYPYSIVPGGVRDAQELKWAADHDPVVRAHYAGFDYDHARVVRLVLARTAFVSYRIGNKVYWTRRRIKLKKGETVLTDGKIMARTRCANRVEEVPQQANSSSEPPAAVFEEPVMPSLGTATQGPPVLFQSTLSSPSESTAPLSVYSPLAGGLWIPIFPPPLPGVCGLGKKTTSGGKKKGGPCAPGGGGGGEVPEPGTWLLVGTGLALTYWTTRRGHSRI